MTDLYNPKRSLKYGNWFKLICGASYQHLPAVRNLTLAYTLAGADCIDVAADSAVIAAAQEGLEVASRFVVDAHSRGFGLGKMPWLMVSLNDGEDPHFRKAQFNPKLCPADCPRPCEQICPAQAIIFERYGDNSGVVQERCYGCGRCLPICPGNLIYTRSYVSTGQAIARDILSTSVDALEIHTQIGRNADFQRLWSSVKPIVNNLKLLAISCPDGDGLIDYLWSLYELISPLKIPLIWQTDGRPMSGDIGDGTTLAAVKLGQKVLQSGLPGYVQLAGGTNSYTVAKLRRMGLLRKEGDQLANAQFCRDGDLSHLEWRDAIAPISTRCEETSHHNAQYSYVAGVAYGSYARGLLTPILNQLEKEVNQVNVAPARLEESELLWQAVELAQTLVSQLKSPQLANC